MLNSGFTLELAVLIAASIMTLGIGFFALSRDPNSATNRLFAFLSVCLVGWSFAGYFSLQTTGDAALLVIKITFALVVLQNAGFFFLAYTYPFAKFVKPRRFGWPYILLTVLILVALPTQLIIKGYGDGTGLVPGPLIPLFITHATLSVGIGFTKLIKRYKTSEHEERSRVSYLLMGSIILWGVVPLTNFIMPLVFGVNAFVRASALYVLLFAVIIGIAIVKHRLFDIRLIVARSLAYLLTFGVFLVVYSGLFVSIAYVFLPNNEVNIKQLSVFVVLAVIFSPTVNLIKHFFDKYTNRLFYRDAYDGQSVIAELNNVLVSSIQIETILKKSSAVIEKNLKVSFCTFVIYEGANALRYEGSKVLQPNAELETVLSGLSLKSVLIVDDLRIRHSDTYGVLNTHGIAAIVRLTTHVGKVGYIILGQKLSGNTYGDGDVDLLRLMANELAIASQNALRFEQIENFNITLQQKVNGATKELRTTNDKLKALDEAKDEFISMASHQLRTPLTSVKGYLSMLGEGDAGKLNETQKKFIDQAFVSSQRMVYLIADLLNVSRLKTGKFIIESQPVYLPDLIESEIAQLVGTVQSHGLTMQFDKPKEFPTLMLDETKIRQVVMNFTDNAIYYTPAGGSVVLTLQQVGDSVEFAVKDDGMGVAKAEQPHLFTKFYRAGNARKARPDGTGLGLFMAKKVIVASGGSLIFKSTEGKGSTFGFRFSAPKNKAP